MITEVKDKEFQSLQARKAHKYKYYKEKLDEIDRWAMEEAGIGGVGRYYKTKVNFDLYANEVDPKFIIKSCGYQTDTGEISDSLVHYDIFSGKIKILEGLELQRPFPYRLMAVNPHATTEHEKETFNLYMEFIMQEMERAMVEAKAKMSLGPDASPEEVEHAQQKMLADLERRKITAEDIEKYQSRKHQSPAEVLGNHILNYLKYKNKLPMVFNKGWRYGMLSSYEVYWVGVVGKVPTVKAIHPQFFVAEMSPDSDYIEDGQRAAAHFVMTPDAIIQTYGPHMTTEQKKRVYRNDHGHQGRRDEYRFNWDSDPSIDSLNLMGSHNYYRVVHGAWKTMRKLGELTYMDKSTGMVETTFVAEQYKFDEDEGDISISWDYYPDVMEGVIIRMGDGDDIYIMLGPSKYQPRSLDNPYVAKLPFYGCRYDLDNNRSTCPGDRIRSYSMYYDILMHRIDKKIAQNKGKKAAIDYRAIPDDMTPEEWTYYINADDLIYLEPKTEGTRDTTAYEITNLIKEVDMSGVSGDIEYYQRWADRIAQKAGEAVGITPEMEGQIEERQAVQNVRTLITNVSRKLEPLFRLHDQVKANVLQALIHTARVFYSTQPSQVLQYITDDLGMAQFKLDTELLSLTDYGIFVPDITEALEAEQMLESWVLASLQNGTIMGSDAMKVKRSHSLIDKEEALIAGEKRVADQAAAREERIEKARQETLAMQDKTKEREHLRAIELLDREWAHRKENDWTKSALVATGFAEDKDANKNKVPDSIELAKLANEQRKLEQQQEKLELEKKKQRVDEEDKRENRRLKEKQLNKSTAKA